MRRALVLLASLAGCSGAKSEPAPYGEALVVVDTDLSVPQIAGRLRVDVFSETGTWLDSRDIGRGDPLDWPASFSVYSDDDTREQRALVRLRVYPEGFVRDYAGERFDEKSVLQEPHVASSLADLCAQAPELPIGGRLTLRSGDAELTDIMPYKRCVPPARSGSVAARVNVAAAGSYRFDVATAVPYFTTPLLFLRSRCDDPSSQIACEYEPTAPINSSGHFPRFDVTLTPGTYWLMTAGDTPGWPADLTLEVVPVDTPLAPVQVAPEPKVDPSPRLVREGIDVTPSTEPEPSAAVDRLIAVRLAPGVRGSVHVTLRGACAGTQAMLGADPHRVDLGGARTCVDTENVRVPVADETSSPDLSRPTESARGTFGPAEGCEPDASGSRAVCIPGGVFLFGTRLAEAASGQREADAPPRIAVMHRFWIDREEVTVGRMRAAVSRGFVVGADDIVVNDVPPTSTTPTHWCSWSSTPGTSENLAVSCITWRAARAFCIAEGGDLPTEAQWEYVAMAAGRAQKTLYPWGDDEPSCDRVSYGRAPPGNTWGGTTSCRGEGPEPVGASARDVTPNGVVGLTGGVGEWMRDAAESFASPCWRAATLVDPACLEEQGPVRVVRGASWDTDPYPMTTRLFVIGALSVGRDKHDATIPASSDVGFRCVYGKPP